MTPGFSIDTREFQQALRECLLNSKRELGKALNARMFFLWVRIFALLPPHNVVAAREKIREMLNNPVGDRRFDKKSGKKVSRGRMLQSKHLIIQAKRSQEGIKGLYGADMKKASASFSRRAIGSVGYLKSAAVKIIKAFNGHFSQYGSKFKIGRRKGSEGYSVKSPRQVGGVNQVINKYGETQANAALIRVNAQYNIIGGGNVAIHKGAKAVAYTAKMGFNPRAIAVLNIGVADDQVNRVSGIYNGVVARAFADEQREMEEHLAAVGQSVADEFNA